MTMATRIELTSTSPEHTIEIGRRLATILEPGMLVALVGQLGAGKTQLTKGIALGLGVPDARLVSSPTFVLINEYEGRVPVHHIDAYRLSSVGEFEALGIDELRSDGVVILEWADRVREAIDGDVIGIELTLEGATQRKLCIFCDSPRLADRLAKLRLSD